MITAGIAARIGPTTGTSSKIATKSAKKHMIKVERTANHSIPHILEAKYSSAAIVIFPAKNKGLIAGSAVRSVLELAGITDVNAKIRSGSKNKLNIAQATIKALSALKSEARSPKPEEASKLKT